MEGCLLCFYVLRSNHTFYIQILLLSNKVWHSPTVRASLAQLAESAELDSEVLIRAVKTHWNTYTHVLERTIELREVLGDLCDMAQFNKPGRGCGLHLRNLILTDEEWDIIEQLYRLLQVSTLRLVSVWPLCTNLFYYSPSSTLPCR